MKTRYLSCKCSPKWERTVSKWSPGQPQRFENRGLLAVLVNGDLARFYSCVLPGSCQLLERYLFLKEKVKKTKLFGSENYNFGMGFSVYFTV